jgi:hypothetical protein
MSSDKAAKIKIILISLMISNKSHLGISTKQKIMILFIGHLKIKLKGREKKENS